MLGDPVGQQAGPRQLDHRPDQVGAGLGALLAADPLDQPADQLELALVVDQRDHDLDLRGLAAAGPRRCGRPEDRPALHRVDLREEDPQPHAAGAEHRVGLLQRPDAVERVLELGEVVAALDPRPLGLGLDLVQRREELVQRRVEQADRDRQARHRREDPLEVGLLVREQLAQRRRRARRRRRPGSPRTIAAWRSSPKNMCSVRHSPMPSAPKSRARSASSGVSALVRIPSRRCSSAQRRICAELLGDLGLDQRHVVDGDRAGRAVDGDQVALGQLGPSPITQRRARSISSADGAGDGRDAHAARDQRGVRRLAALAGEDAPAPRGSRRCRRPR